MPKDAHVAAYAGELIGSRASDIREQRYEGQGIDSTYLFRFGRYHVVDATYIGNAARFVNHSCDPNCVAWEHAGMGIHLKTTRPIGVGEEITYDYKLPPEQDESKRVPCLCGSAKCRHWINLPCK
jgi:histone-lysine N-methyltransferase SETD1